MASIPYNGFSGSFRSQVGSVVYGNIRSGVWPRPERCEVCGSRERRFLQAHLENYDDPTSYVGICRRCHMALHKRFSNPEGWLALLDGIEEEVDLFGEVRHRVPAWARELSMTRIDLRAQQAGAAADG